jgi:excisionase family DNA binding protein
VNPTAEQERLSPRVEALAERIADLAAQRVLAALAERPPMSDELDAAAVAELLGVTRSTVYGLADELGGYRIGDGPRARLRFQREAVDAYKARRHPPAETATPEPNGRPRRAKGSVDLLPIRGAPQ